MLAELDVVGYGFSDRYEGLSVVSIGMTVGKERQHTFKQS